MMPTARRNRSVRRRLVLAGRVCVGIVLVLVVAGIALGRTGSFAGSATTTTATPTPTTTVATLVVAPPPSTTTTRTPTTRPPSLLERTLADAGALAVQAPPEGIDVRTAPESDATLVKHFPPKDQLGTPTTFLVAGEARDTPGGGWYQVLLPQRPNGSTGWVRAADVTTIALTYTVRISLGAHRLDLYQQGELRASFPVAVGKKGTLTPTGDFYMVTKVRPATQGGPYGVLAIGLSAFSDTLTDWVGGGQVAIHGTNEPDKIGTDASHGCVRMQNADILQLSAATPLGTPVSITP
jgi:lipoprotein-anchoring transpeptidase ErfK/SrfK